MPVDLYVGGAEHAVLHLLYSRFWHKVLFDRGHVKTAEPFKRLVNQGMILGEMEYNAFRDNAGAWVQPNQRDKPGVEPVRLTEEQVEKKGDTFVLKSEPTIKVDARANKMSKSRGNVINPDEVVKEYGADSLRLYEMFMGPLEATKPWSMRGVEGVYRFLSRVWRVFMDDRSEEMRLNPQVSNDAPDPDTLRLLHQTIKRVTDDLDNMRFNTAIAAMMEYTNPLTAPVVVRIALNGSDEFIFYFGYDKDVSKSSKFRIEDQTPRIPARGVDLKSRDAPTRCPSSKGFESDFFTTPRDKGGTPRLRVVDIGCA